MSDGCNHFSFFGASGNFKMSPSLPGPPGPPGKSAYEAAVEGGYTGTEAEFNAALAEVNTALQPSDVDAELSDSSTNPVQNKVVKAEIDDLKSALGTDAIIKFAGYISSDAWSTDSRALSVLIAVKPGSRINVKATSVGNDSIIAAIKNVTLPITNGSPVTYSSDSTWSAPIHITKNQSFSGIAPADIEYLYYYCGFSSSNFNRMPVSVEINDYDYLQSAIENITETNTYLYETSERLAVVESKTDVIQTLNNLLRRSGSIADGVWTRSNTFSHILYPVNPGDVVEVFGKSGNTAYIAGLKTGEVVWGQVPGYSEEIGWTGVITIDGTRHWYGIIPDDVHYLYMYYGSDAVIHLPSEVYVNGYNIIESIDDNITTKNTRTVDSYEYFGNLTDNGWAEIGNTRYSYLIVPVESGNTVVIVSKNLSGSTTYIGVLREYSNPVNGGAANFSEAVGFTGLITMLPNTCKSFAVPSDAKYIYAFEGLTPPKNKQPLLFAVDGFDIISGKQVFDDTPVNIRLMQYNIGKFAFGYSNISSSSTFGLLSLIAYDVPDTVRKHQDYTYQEYVTHYRKMLCEYQPDIIGMEEYVNPINVMVTTDPDVCVEKSMAVEVFDMTYPNVVYTENRQQSIRAKVLPLGSKEMSYRYTVADVTYESSFTVAYFLYCGKLICVGCNALDSNATDEGMAKRRAQLPAILDMFPDEDFVFLMFDVNNGGNFRTTPEGTPGYVSSPEDGQALLDIAKNKGWNFAHGSYLPFEVTWFAPTGSGYPDWAMTIDNIIYKDNGKTVFRSVEKMPIDKAKELSSDHCPLIGDFLLI